MLVTFNPGLTNTNSLNKNCCGGKKVAFNGCAIDYSQIARPSVAGTLAIRLVGGVVKDIPPGLKERVEELLRNPKTHPDTVTHLTTVNQYL